MKRNKILLSSGIFPWLTLSEITNIAYENSFDGIELVPTRQIIKSLKTSRTTVNSSDLRSIKGLHQSWRLDIGQDKKYSINKFNSLIFIILRFILFPPIKESTELLQSLSKTLKCPATVHGLSDNWTKDNQGKEFLGGISYEIMDTSTDPDTLRDWLKNANHSIVVDSRDDQSLQWAKKYGFRDWKELWTWIGFKKIKGIQLTLIGLNGIRKILNHKKTLPEEQLLWLHEKRWEGNVTVEVNPISLFISNKGQLREGLKIISSFTRQTLIHGKNWSY